MGLFSFVRRNTGRNVGRGPAGACADGAAASRCAELGRGMVALRLRGEPAPPDCVQVVFGDSGQARRVPAATARGAEAAYCFHPGPYGVDLVPFPAAPEIGLRTRFVIDAADPRVAQQRFDLYLFSEVPEALPLAALQAAIEAAVQDALAQGMLELPPCTSLDEWNGFRAGLNQLLYTRFGVTVDDCVPVDLADVTDYAASLRARAGDTAQPAMAPGCAMAAPAYDVSKILVAPVREPVAAPPAISPPASVADAAAAAAAPPLAAAGDTVAPPAVAAAAKMAPMAAGDDAHALRRLFLELPALSGGLRLVALPPGQAVFLAHRSLLQRIALCALDVGTMPALAWSAPDVPAPDAQRQRRARHSVQAVRELDQAWALLARLQLAANPLKCRTACTAVPEAALAALLDEGDRLAANLAHHLAGRRLAEANQEPSR